MRDFGTEKVLEYEGEGYERGILRNETFLFFETDNYSFICGETD